MKIIIRFCILIAVSFLLASCGKVAVSTEQSQNGSPLLEVEQQVAADERDQVSGNYGVYDMKGELVDKLNKNPIDVNYEVELKELNQSEIFSTLAQVELESKYTKLWDTELNAIYNKLLSKLNSIEKELLIQSQKGWLQHHMKESEFVNQVFNLRESGPVFGSQGRVQMQQAINGRIRERTLELMEYYSLLGNDVQFVFIGTKK
ncbi:lysozyme inhibitor LprI family protein [Desulfosporosinus shakirovi]|uniref:lysozyme inhibitor LprI family protein n=1 Tax=Desulfosporosinus shakirovi TaxID=2885154 RepID=UPI001E47B832|nr:lysozyme inhibitor LprI family protein [Desulfosporosinus sp. SRJS8]MCB8814413.1 lysozyme inhibitor LprI family protein [Desulfosporosinus sp. SRJS8]